MPTNYINSLSKEHKIPVKKLEEIWEKAKDASSNKNNYGIITTIFKSMINKQFDLNENKKEVNLFITNKTMYMEENSVDEQLELIIEESVNLFIGNIMMKAKLYVTKELELNFNKQIKNNVIEEINKKLKEEFEKIK